MKSAFIGYISAIIIIITFLIVGNIQINSNVTNETMQTLDNALYSTELELYANQSTITNETEYEKSFVSLFENQMNGNGIDYTISIYGINYEKGLLDVGVSATYQNLLKQDRTIEDRQTMVLDNKE